MNLKVNIRFGEAEKVISIMIHKLLIENYNGMSKKNFVRSLIVDEMRGNRTIIAKVGINFIQETDWKNIKEFYSFSYKSEDEIAEWLNQFDNKSYELKRIVKQRIMITNGNEVEIDMSAFNQLCSYQLTKKTESIKSAYSNENEIYDKSIKEKEKTHIEPNNDTTSEIPKTTQENVMSSSSNEKKIEENKSVVKSEDKPPSHFDFFEGMMAGDFSPL